MARRFCALVAVLAIAVGGYWVYGVWRFRTDLSRARTELAKGRYAAARRLLTELARRSPAEGEVQYSLGMCEQALGRSNAALAAWERVPADSPQAANAALMRARAAFDAGRYSIAEGLLRAALHAPGSTGIEACQSLALLLKLEGRTREAAQTFRDGFTRMPSPIATLTELWDLQFSPYPVEQVRAALDRAAKTAPDDPGVWLGRASFATRVGQFEAAGRWFSDCERQAPRDPVVARARLSWAIAAGRDKEARNAVGILAREPSPPAEVLTAQAWFAGRRNDSKIEREVLEKLAALEPIDLSALDRLAEVAYRAGDMERATHARQVASKQDRLREQYRDLLFFSTDILAQAEELARVAQAIGLRFEAQQWLKLALAADPKKVSAQTALARLAASQPEPHKMTFAVVIEELEHDNRKLASGESSESPRIIPQFQDDADSVGLRFVYEPGRLSGRELPETMGGGIGLLDYDRDGWVDVYLVQGGQFPPNPAAPHTGDRLFHNKGDGTLEDVTARAGLAGSRGYGHGVAVGDYDADGRPDLFVTRWRSYALYHNRGDGTFEDVTASAGLGGDRDWPTSAAFADLDDDGDLDLYVCHYLKWADEGQQAVRPGHAQQGTRYNNPLNYYSVPDHLFRNDGGRFVDVTAAAGIEDKDGRGLGVLAADIDGDRKIDLYVANDLTANFLFRNLGGMRFEEVGHPAGVAANAEGVYQGSMGVAGGDLDGDGLIDIAVTNFYGDSMAYYQGIGPGLFADHSAAVGLSAPTRYKVGWGVAFFDANNDGRPDLGFTNGHLDESGGRMPYAMPSQLFLGGPDGRLTEVTDRAGPGWGLLRVGRALATGDLDNDGRVDVLIVAHDHPLAYLHNNTNAGASLTLRLEGTTSNRDAIGAKVVITAGGQHHTAWRFGGGSYQSSGEERIHFGLDRAKLVESVEVQWTSGRVDRFQNLDPNRGYHLREGDQHAKALPGFSK
jgi:tetratricopeptide (TPR) repeat protein